MPAILTPAGLPEALAALKAWLAITSDGEDAALSALLLSASEICDAFTGGSLAEAEWADQPQAIRHGIIRLAAHLFSQRGTDAAPPVAPPVAIVALWRPWRQLHLA